MRRELGVAVLGLALLACAPAQPGRSGDAYERRVSALASSPAVGPELPLDAPVRVQWDGPGIGIAAGPSNHLLVWEGNSYLYGARVGFDGTLVDQLPFRVTPGVGTQRQARVAASGTDWLVAYSNDDGSGAVQVAAARVAADGTVRDADGLALTTGAGDHLLQDVASDGSGYLVTWDAQGIQAAIVTAAGAAQAPFMVGSATPSGSAGLSAVAFNGSQYLVAYAETVGSNRYLRARRVSSAGALVGSIIELGTVSAVSLLDVASDGTSWLVSYVSDALRWQVVASDGTLGGNGSVAGTFGGATTDPVSRLSSTGNGAGFTLCTIQGSALFAARISGAGVLVASATPVVSGDVFEVAVDRGGGSDYVAYVAATPSGIVTAPARGSHLDSSLKLDSSPMELSFRANDQESPHAAFNGTNYLTVWEDARGSQSQAPGGLWLGPPAGTVYGRLISADGQPLGSSSFTIAPVGVRGLMPDLASNGTDYLVVWRQDGGTGLYARRVTAAGAVVDTNAIPIDVSAGEKRFPAVDSNGKDYYVAWSVGTAAIRGARVLADGTMPSAPTTLTSAALSGIDNPGVAFNGMNYLVVWAQSDRVLGARVNPATGAALDSIAIGGSSSVGAYRPAVASNGTEWLVAWDSNRDIRAARVGADGVVKDLNGITIDSGSDTQLGVSVAWTGSSYWVSWSAPANVIAAKRVTPDGAVVDAAGVPIAGGIYYSAAAPMVDVAAGGGDRALFVYERYELARGAAERAYARVVPAPVASGGNGGKGGSAAAGGGAGKGGAGGVAGAGGGAGMAGVGGATSATGGSTAGAAGGGGRGGGSGGGPGGAAGGGGASNADGGAKAGAGGNSSGSGCGCRQAPGSPPLGSLAWVLAALCLRRRSRSSDVSR
jgi:hypothetical protein